MITQTVFLIKQPSGTFNAVVAYNSKTTDAKSVKAELMLRYGTSSEITQVNHGSINESELPIALVSLNRES